MEEADDGHFFESDVEPEAEVPKLAKTRHVFKHIPITWQAVNPTLQALRNPNADDGGDEDAFQVSDEEANLGAQDSNLPTDSQSIQTDGVSVGALTCN